MNLKSLNVHVHAIKKTQIVRGNVGGEDAPGVSGPDAAAVPGKDDKESKWDINQIPALFKSQSD